MADCIESQLTQSLKDRLETLKSYPNKSTPTVELERTVLTIGNRYPYITLCGPQTDTDDKTPNATHDTLTYIIKYYVNKNDENDTENTELPYLTRNVAADIERHIMNDVSRGALSENTRQLEDGYAYDLSEEAVWEFYVYVVVEISVLINKLDPYVSG